MLNGQHNPLFWGKEETALNWQDLSPNLPLVKNEHGCHLVHHTHKADLCKPKHLQAHLSAPMDVTRSQWRMSNTQVCALLKTKSQPHLMLSRSVTQGAVYATRKVSSTLHMAPVGGKRTRRTGASQAQQGSAMLSKSALQHMSSLRVPGVLGVLLRGVKIQHNSSG